MIEERNRSKKKVLNETELALRREETARKRKHLTEKKLQDEKVICVHSLGISIVDPDAQAETINRLLKKQTRPRNRRGTALDDRSPMPGIGRKVKAKVKDDEGEGVEEGGTKTMLWRWLGRRSSPSCSAGLHPKRSMVIPQAWC